MPYVIRDHNHQIIALFKEQPLGSNEFLRADEVEVVAFLQQGEKQTDDQLEATDQVKSALEESDKELARATEDLIHLLIAKNLILFTELPVPVQEKLLNRERLRSNLQVDNDNFLDDGGLI